MGGWRPWNRSDAHKPLEVERQPWKGTVDTQNICRGILWLRYPCRSGVEHPLESSGSKSRAARWLLDNEQRQGRHDHIRGWQCRDANRRDDVDSSWIER